MLIKRFCTDRLVFREFQDDDKEPLCEIARDSRFEFAGLPSEHVVGDFIRKARSRIDMKEEGGLRYGFRLAVVEIETGKLAGAGIVGLADLERLGKVRDIAYFIAPDQWGKGLGKEVAYAMASLAFNYYDIPHLYGTTSANNIASAKVMQAIGMRHVETDKAHFDALHGSVDRDVYRMSKDDLRQPLAQPIKISCELGK